MARKGGGWQVERLRVKIGPVGWSHPRNRFHGNRPAQYAGRSASAVDVAVGDGEAAVPTEGSRRDLDAGRRLTTLVLVAVHHTHHAGHEGLIEAHRHDLFN